MIQGETAKTRRVPKFKHLREFPLQTARKGARLREYKESRKLPDGRRRSMRKLRKQFAVPVPVRPDRIRISTSYAKLLHCTILIVLLKIVKEHRVRMLFFSESAGPNSKVDSVSLPPRAPAPCRLPNGPALQISHGRQSGFGAHYMQRADPGAIKGRIGK